ncbi:MAG: hypothetical protein JWO38_1740, partial [Gemmataceae bacterium]|nr:hypothetical protein [Gemmataceae bacterium]
YSTRAVNPSATNPSRSRACSTRRCGGSTSQHGRSEDCREVTRRVESVSRKIRVWRTLKGDPGFPRRGGARGPSATSTPLTSAGCGRGYASPARTSTRPRPRNGWGPNPTRRTGGARKSGIDGLVHSSATTRPTGSGRLGRTWSSGRSTRWASNRLQLWSGRRTCPVKPVALRLLTARCGRVTSPSRPHPYCSGSWGTATPGRIAQRPTSHRPVKTARPACRLRRRSAPRRPA